MVTLTTSAGSTLELSNIVVMALLIPKLGFPVVGALCLNDAHQHVCTHSMETWSNVNYHAMIPLSGSETRDRSSITPSVLVLWSVSHGTFNVDFNWLPTNPPTSTPILRFLEGVIDPILQMRLNSQRYEIYGDPWCGIHASCQVSLMLGTWELPVEVCGRVSRT